VIRKRVALGCLLVWTALTLAAIPARQGNAQQCSNTIHGSSQGIVGCIQLHAGLAIAHVRSNGTQNFAASLETQDPSYSQPLTQNPAAYKDTYSLYNVVGRVEGAVAVYLPADDTYYLSVTYASGPYDITFEQPTPETATVVNQSSFSGTAQQVTQAFHLTPGPMTVTVQSNSSALKLWLYALDDLGGTAITPVANPDAYHGELVDTTGGPPLSQTVEVMIPKDGLYLFYVYTDGNGSLAWNVSIN
jgi:hypothetical protein